MQTVATAADLAEGHDITHDPVGCRLGGTPRCQHRLEELCSWQLISQNQHVCRGQAQLAVTLPEVSRQLRHALLHRQTADEYGLELMASENSSSMTVRHKPSRLKSAASSGIFSCNTERKGV